MAAVRRSPGSRTPPGTSSRSSRRAELAAKLDELYREHPSGFVATRDRIAKELRSAGDRAEADRVEGLRRPTAAAWLLNRAALRDAKALKAFASASEALEKAQRRALEGKDEGGQKWRAAAAREREAVAAVLDAAEEAASEAGHPATKQALDLADGTLRAAAADPELRATVVAGRLDRERSGATLGGLDVGAAPAASDRLREKKAAKQSAKDRGAAQARRELKRLVRHLSAAEAREAKQAARVEEASDALRDEKAGLAEAKKETTALRRQVKAAEKRAK